MKTYLTLLLALVFLIQIGQIAGNAEAATRTPAPSELEQALALDLVPVGLQSDYDASCTREEFCRFLVLLVEQKLGKDIDSILSARGAALNPMAFRDTSDHEILAASALGIISGTGAGIVDPDEKINREQAAAMLYRAANLFEIRYNPTDAFFGDFSSISDYAIQAVRFVNNCGLMLGTGKDSFSPKGLVTRQQGAAIMLRLSKLIDHQADVVYLCAIGNSLLYSGDTTGKLAEICSRADFEIVLDYYLISSAVLVNTISGIEGMYGSDYFRNNHPDFIILNEHGSMNYHLSEGLDKLYEMGIPDDTRVIYVMTQFDYQGSQDELKKYDWVEVCDAYAFQQQLINQKRYDYTELHMPSDYHPNELAAFLNACMLFVKMYDKNPTDYIGKSAPGVHGDTEDERLEETKLLAKMAWEFTNNH